MTVAKYIIKIIYLRQAVRIKVIQNKRTIKIRKIISIGIGKIHIDTGFSKTPITFEADVFLPSPSMQNNYCLCVNLQFAMHGIEFVLFRHNIFRP